MLAAGNDWPQRGRTMAMHRAFETLSAALLTSSFCLFPIACESPEQDRPATTVATAEVEPAPAPAPAPDPAPEAPAEGG